MIIYDISKLNVELQNQINTNPKYIKWFSEFPNKLLGVNNDTKTIRGLEYGVKTGILYLIPHKISGVNICPMADIAQCHKPCLNTAGRGAMKGVQISRLRKTLYFQQYQKQFLAQLKNEIEKHCIKSIKENYLPAIRLNGTSDIRWELYIWEFMEDMHHKYNVNFYDYTKLANRIIPNSKVYDLTFSYSGVKNFQPYVQKAIALNMRLAVVFRNKDKIPPRFLNMDCINGDNSDIRFTEPQGVVVALYAKGKARQDKTGFVVE